MTATAKNPKRLPMRDAGENIFADLGLPHAEDHYLKAQLVARIIQVLRARKLTQSAAAELMGIKQPDVSNLVHGRFRGYSIERILAFLRALDQDIEIVVSQKARRKAALRVTVKAA